MFAFLNRFRRSLPANRSRMAGGIRQPRWRPQLEELEVRVTPSANVFVSGGVLYAVGDNASYNSYTLDHSGSITSLCGVLIPDAAYNSVQIYTGTGFGDETDVNVTLPGKPVTIFEQGFGLQNVEIAKSSGLLDNIQGNVIVYGNFGSGGASVLDTHDENDLNPDTYTITAQSIQRSNAATITYYSIWVMDIYGGVGGASFNIASTVVPLQLFDNGPGTVNIGSAGQVQGIQGLVSIENVSGFFQTAVTVDDSADSTPRNVTLDTTNPSAPGYEEVTGLAPAWIWCLNSTTLTLKTGSGGAVVNVLGTSVPTTLYGNGQSGDIVNVGDSVVGLQSIRGPLNVFNPPSFSKLNLNDSGDNGNRTVWMGVDPSNPSMGIIIGLAPAPISFGLYDVAAVNVISGGPGTNDVFWVSQTLLYYGWPLTFQSGGGSFTVIYI